MWVHPQNTLLPILQSKFGSAESEPFAHFQRMKPRTTTTGNMNGSFLIWNLTIFFWPIPKIPVTILTPNSRDWWTKVTGKAHYLPMSFQSQGSDSVFATEHWPPQGASQYSALFFTKLTLTQVSGTQRISRTLNVISYPTNIFGDELSRTSPHPLNAVNGGKKCKQRFSENKSKIHKISKTIN